MTKKKQPIIPELTVLRKPKDTFKKELEERIAKGKDLQNRQVTAFPQLEELQKDFATWDDFNEELLRRSFNKTDNEYFTDYNRCTQWLGLDDVMHRRDTSSGEYKLNHEKKKINSAVINLERLVEKLPLIDEDENIQSYTTTDKTFTNKCFVVHGHDEARKYEIARFIENDLRKRTIILHEQPNKGRTIIEKFEDYSKVDFAVALWTADDEGKSKTETDSKDRARQNVIFETGFFIGAIGRQNVIVLFEDGVEIPSDYSGVIFIRLAGNWKDDLRKEVDAIYLP
ncbi:MAG: TIR domain-containing protein [Bacteroidia bacterium]